MNGADLAVLGRTVVHLRPSQGVHRARLRIQQAGLRRFPEAGRWVLSGPDPSAAAGWPDAFRPVDALTPARWPTLPELRAGKVSLLGQLRELGDASGWDHADAPGLWRFHLQYWDWAWGLAVDPDRPAAQVLFARLWRSWQASAGFGRGYSWHPYTAALRAWSWCGLHRNLAVGSDIEPDFVAGLAAHVGFLRWHLEYDVGGNHLIKGLKALVGLAVFFADSRLLRLATRRLTRQLTRQILADGGHYERAPAYHCQVLSDLVDVADLLQAAGRVPAGEITAAVDRMRHWLGGLVRAVAGSWHLLADVGPPCPPSLPAHAHADTLGCLVHVDKVPLLIDTGTSTYEPGPVRRHERSTAAHSTVQVDGADSTEVWGIFRAGRRARVSGLAVHTGPSGITCEAVHNGFRCLPGRPLHRRRWSLTSEELQVEDLVTGRGRHEVVIRWQLAVGTVVRVGDGMALVNSPAGAFSVTIAATAPVLLAAETRPVAAGFGSTTDAPVLTCRINAALPVRATTVWSRARDRSAEGEMS
jgi:uncharacterized heparinase superfamily protein